MKRADSKRVPNALPTFLDESPATMDAAPTTTEEEQGLTDDAGAVGETPASGDADPEANEPLPETDPMATAGGSGPSAAAASTPNWETRTASRRGQHNGGASLGLGATVLLFALVTLAMPSVASVAADWGVPSNILFVLGTLLVAAGAIQRHIGHLQQRLDEAEDRRRLDSDNLQQNLQQLVADKNGRPAPEGDQLQHVLLSLQRQDEKIANLTKAIKMYGKPLMEISNQGTELAANLGGVKTLVEGGSEAMRLGLQRMEAQLRTPAHGKELADLQASLHKLATRIETLAAAKTTLDVAPLQAQLGRLEVNLAAVAQRLDDKEVHKSLLRLEDASLKSREAMQELLRGETIGKAATQLQERLEQATKRLADGLTQMRDGNLGGLDHGLREIHREMSGVATTVAQIHAAVRGGVRLPTSVAGAPPAAIAESAAPPTPMAPAVAPTAAAPAVPSTAPNEGATGYQTGARKTASKNVLGAIAKLKQMKG